MNATRPAGRVPAQRPAPDAASPCAGPASPILVLGLGNDLLADDAVGLRIVGVVRDRLAGDPRIEVRASGEMGLALLDLIADREAVVVVDSIEGDGIAPGGLRELAPGLDGPPRDWPPHAFGIGDLCRFGRISGLAMPRHLRIFAIGVAGPFVVGGVMHPAVADAVEPAADAVIQRALQLADATADDPRAARGAG